MHAARAPLVFDEAAAPGGRRRQEIQANEHAIRLSPIPFSRSGKWTALALATRRSANRLRLSGLVFDAPGESSDAQEKR